jgi:hypothetical protein
VRLALTVIGGGIIGYGAMHLGVEFPVGLTIAAVGGLLWGMLMAGFVS